MSRHPKAYSFRAPPRSARTLAEAKFRAMSLANNHALDFGAEGLRDCVTQLSKESIEAIGVGQTTQDAFTPKFFPLSSERKVALLAINGLESEASLGRQVATASDRARLKEAIAKAHDQASLVVCLVHWGIENTTTVTEDQHELARWLVDRGVDVVVGSHPHCVQALDFYHGCPIAYSLGNLVFDGAATVASWNHGALLEIGVDDEVRAPAARLIPVVLEDGFPKVTAPGSAVLARDQTAAF